MLLDWTCYRLQAGKAAMVLEMLQAAQPDGELYGVWRSVVGADDRIYLMTAAAQESGEALRAQLLAAEGIFAPAPYCIEIETSRFHTLNALPEVTEGEHGAVYEIRSYELQPAEALALAEKGWADVLDARLSLKPITTVMHSVDGVAPRLIHIYPYQSLAERITVRNQAIATGKWPPKGGAGRNRLMATELAIPAAFSTIR